MLALTLVCGSWYVGNRVGGNVAFAVGCQPNRFAHDAEARYVYTSGSAANLTGITARIEEYDPWYSGYNDTGTNASVMVLRRNPTIQWAQFGWAKWQLSDNGVPDGVTKRRVFTEVYLSDPENFFQAWAAEPIGQMTKYKIQDESFNGVWDFYLEGSYWTSEVGWFAPTEYLLFGETHDRADQMPGMNANPVDFTLAKYLTGTNHASHTVATQMGFSGANASLYYNFDDSQRSIGAYKIWDKC